MSHPQRNFRNGIIIFILSILGNFIIWNTLVKSEKVVLVKNYVDTCYVYDTTTFNDYHRMKIQHLRSWRSLLTAELKLVNSQIRRLECRLGRYEKRGKAKQQKIKNIYQ
jgi:hypothetical protein